MVADFVGGHEPVAFLPFAGPVAVVVALATLPARRAVAPLLVVAVAPIEVSVAVEFAVPIKVAVPVANDSRVDLATVTQISLANFATAINFAGACYRPLVLVALK
jgi:hypothetical protein